jgi:hypothetical protein
MKIPACLGCRFKSFNPPPAGRPPAAGRPFYSNFDWLRRIDRQTDCSQVPSSPPPERSTSAPTGTGTLLLLLGPNKKITHAGPRTAGHFDYYRIYLKMMFPIDTSLPRTVVSKIYSKLRFHMFFCRAWFFVSTRTAVRLTYIRKPISSCKLIQK